MEGRTEKLMRLIRKSPLFEQLVPQEAGIGWPIPLRKEKNVYIKLPMFGFAPKSEDGKTALFPPFSIITIDWASGKPVEYLDLHYVKPDENLQWQGQQVGVFPHQAVADWRIGEYKEKRSELLQLYDELFNKLVQEDQFTDEWKNKFSKLLAVLVEPSLKPYYHALGAKFFGQFLGVYDSSKSS